MNEIIINLSVSFGFGFVVFGVYQISPAWSFIVAGLGIGSYGILAALTKILKGEEKKK